VAVTAALAASVGTAFISDAHARERVFGGSWSSFFSSSSSSSVAGAVACYVYRNTQHVTDYAQYKALRYGLEHVKFNVDGKSVGAQDLLVASILKQGPGLQGTRIAEDPAAVLAYGRSRLERTT
jgi:hypothetical protein